MLRIGRLASSLTAERGVSNSLRYFSSAAARVRIAPTKRTTFLVKEDRVEVKGTSEDARFINKPLFVHSFPGSRVIELNRPGYGNPLTRSSVGALKNNLELLEDNNIVEIVFVGSCNELTDVFSIGLCPQTLKLNRRGLLSDVSSLAQHMDGYKKKLGSIVSGKMPGTVLGLLLNAKYRLGTPSLVVTVDELSDGYVPAGGLAYNCSRLGGPEGKIVSTLR
jgi:enoyl-CoA hydratase/carnithine racemase